MSQVIHEKKDDINTNMIEGLLAITQGLLLVGLSALAMFVVYLPLSIAVTMIFGVVGSICFLYGIESLRAYLKP
jgi:ABC-type enterochelin transport system permease subunit